MNNSIARKLKFKKMSGAGNDFLIFDARKDKIEFSIDQINRICDKKNRLYNKGSFGCDQLILIKNYSENEVLMEIFNSDGSTSPTCGNATRCVASILMAEQNKNKVKIRTKSGVLNCWKISENQISVDMGIPKFNHFEIPLSKPIEEDHIILHNLKFYFINVGNPHAVAFIDEDLSDEDFLKIGKAVENDLIFTNKTNVEFAKIISDELIEVRVWERGVGETLSCGSGACAVGSLAIKNKLINTTKTNIRFKGGDLLIEFNNLGSAIIMTGDFNLILEDEIKENF
jgi:diaminopimelate epimerase